MSCSRASHTATLLPDGRVLLAGGKCDDGYNDTILDDAQLFDSVTGEFSRLAATMNDHRSEHTATLLPGGQVLLVGGLAQDWKPSITAELLMASTSILVSTGNMTHARAGHTATLLLDGRVLVAGGASDKSAEIYTQQP